jgi:CDP-glycerol glycerophosphotransferase (TagB/SpsB family)/glycosyltransferase involved in cell wall biosynthesis
VRTSVLFDCTKYEIPPETLDFLEDLTVFFDGEIPENDDSDVLVRLPAGVELHPLFFRYVEAYFDAEPEATAVRVPTVNANGKIVSYVTASRSGAAADNAYVLSKIQNKASATAMANERQWLVSCIIPIYNVERYLNKAIDSVIAQSIGFEENVQLILVNDGSPDGCGAICEAYKAQYPENVVYVEQVNRGVSAARNVGLDVAVGEFVAFLDGDDRYDVRFMEVGVEFLRVYGGEVDFVAVPLEWFGAVKEEQVHPLNYKFTDTSIVDITRQHTFIQLNICSTFLKRSAIAETRFCEDLAYTEDGDFLHRILLKKLKYGVMNVAALQYRRRDTNDSAVQISKENPKWYTSAALYLQRVVDASIEKYGYVTRYTQFLMITQMLSFGIQKIPQSILAEFDYDFVVNSFTKATEHIDDDIILNCKTLTYLQKVHLLELKYKQPTRLTNLETDVPYFAINNLQLQNAQAIAWLAKVEIRDNNLQITGVVNLPSYSNMKIAAKYGDKLLDCKQSTSETKTTYYLGKAVNKAYVFDFNILLNVESEETISFFVIISSGIILPCILRYSFTCGLSDLEGSFQLTRGYVIRKGRLQNELSIAKLTADLLKSVVTQFMSNNPEFINNSFLKSLMKMFLSAYSLLHSKKIWVIIDRPERADDNGEHLFRYAKKQNDDIDVYYIISEDSPDYSRLKPLGNVVPYMSEQHILLLMFADVLATSHNDMPVLYPYGAKYRKYLSGFIDYDTVFLQHGNIADDLAFSLNRISKNFKIFVTSSQNEYDSILHFDYGYDEDVVKLTGLPRYDNLIPSNARTKTVVYSPTWRAELSNAMDEYNSSFAESNYCKKISGFLSDTNFFESLNQSGYTLIFRPHPRVVCQISDFAISNYVKVVTNEMGYQDLFGIADILISDYSSVVYDFAYLRKPVIYYQFDENHYKQGFFDRHIMGFGEIVTTKEELQKSILRLVSSDAILPPIYEERINSFFAFNDRANCKRVYDSIKELEGL